MGPLQLIVTMFFFPTIVVELKPRVGDNKTYDWDQWENLDVHLTCMKRIHNDTHGTYVLQMSSIIQGMGVMSLYDISWGSKNFRIQLAYHINI